MQRKSLLASALALLVAGSATFATAQDAAPKAPPAPVAKASPSAPHMAPDGMPGGRGPGFDRAGFRGPGFAGPGFGGPDSPVIEDLRALEHLYKDSGRSKDLPALYNDVLAKSQDPRVRTYAYHQLARVQSAPANTDQAIATLRKSLDENLANEARRRAEFDKMRSEWEQRRGDAKPASAKP
ncbi:MAG TPA: hypothetical protein VFG49_04900 [Dyella sp.]|uniref:hypothetical protein n=1 Tax=Dyella sp. TaxID=1869338 RepID=UPI002D7797D4|nr:hypothetical protein [Dyella sp.]HET6552858.1 hypothetical protein [Dyella sp.]